MAEALMETGVGTSVMERVDAVYAERIKPVLETDENMGRLIAVDAVSGDYELADGPEYLSAVLRLRNRHPEAQIGLLRIGYPAAFQRGIRLWPTR